MDIWLTLSLISLIISSTTLLLAIFMVFSIKDGGKKRKRPGKRSRSILIILLGVFGVFLSFSFVCMKISSRLHSLFYSFFHLFSK